MQEIHLQVCFFPVKKGKETEKKTVFMSSVSVGCLGMKLSVSSVILGEQCFSLCDVCVSFSVVILCMKIINIVADIIKPLCML